MRTGRSLTVCWSLPGRGAVSAPGGCLVGGSLPSPGGAWSGGGICSQGGLLLGGWGVCSQGVCLVEGAIGGCLLPGVSAWSVPGPGGCLLPGGSAWSGGYIPACTEADTPPPPVDRQTPVKILPWPNFVAAGNDVDCKSQFNTTAPLAAQSRNGRNTRRDLASKMLWSGYDPGSV